MTEEQVCIKCCEAFPATEEFFGKNAKYKSGLQRSCKLCMKAANAEKYQKMRAAALRKYEESSTQPMPGVRRVHFKDDWRPNREGIRNQMKDYTGIASGFSKM